jgi:hypothetical protein
MFARCFDHRDIDSSNLVMVSDVLDKGVCANVPHNECEKKKMMQNRGNFKENRCHPCILDKSKGYIRCTNADYTVRCW